MAFQLSPPRTRSAAVGATTCLNIRHAPAHQLLLPSAPVAAELDSLYKVNYKLTLPPKVAWPPSPREWTASSRQDVLDLLAVDPACEVIFKGRPLFPSERKDALDEIYRQERLTDEVAHHAVMSCSDFNSDLIRSAPPRKWFYGPDSENPMLKKSTPHLGKANKKTSALGKF